MNKRQALKQFRQLHLPYIRTLEKNGVDNTRRREAWNNYTDALCKDGKITSSQYNNWDQPF